MFVKNFLFACFVGFGCALERGDLEKYGPFNTIVNSRIMTCNHDRSLNLDVTQIRIHFYDFNKNFHKSFIIKKAAKEILKINNLDKTKTFVMFVGGFTSHIDHSVERQMRRAYKEYPNSYLIIPDHSAYTNNNDGHGINNYKRSVSYVHNIGKALAQMWASLKLGGVNPKNMHFVGHSLGGQILGPVGSTFYNITGEKVPKITALDPAGPCFSNSAIENQVRSGVADYVEVYHCNSGALGSSSVLGDVDFFMNKNGAQNPNCKSPMLPNLFGSSKTASCNHRICVDVWTASLKHRNLFPAYSCESYKMFQEGKCESNLKTMAGVRNTGVATGQYYFSTSMYHYLHALA